MLGFKVTRPILNKLPLLSASGRESSSEHKGTGLAICLRKSRSSSEASDGIVTTRRSCGRSSRS